MLLEFKGHSFFSLVCCSLFMAISVIDLKAEDKITTENSKKVSSKKVSSDKIYATHDFGKVKEGQTPSYSFEFKNSTDKTITILRTRIPCGCAKVTIKNDVLKPGDSTSFRVQLISKKHQGPISKNFYLLTNSKEKPIIKYVVKADILAKPAPICSVPPLVKLASLKPGEICKGNFTIENPGLKDLVINARRPSEAITINTKLPLLVPSRAKGVFNFSLTAPEKGPILEKIVLRTNDKRRSLVQVVITGEVK